MNDWGTVDEPILKIDRKIHKPLLRWLKLNFSKCHNKLTIRGDLKIGDIMAAAENPDGACVNGADIKVIANVDEVRCAQPNIFEPRAVREDCGGIIEHGAFLPTARWNHQHVVRITCLRMCTKRSREVERDEGGIQIRTHRTRTHSSPLFHAPDTTGSGAVSQVPESSHNTSVSAMLAVSSTKTSMHTPQMPPLGNVPSSVNWTVPLPPGTVAVVDMHVLVTSVRSIPSGSVTANVASVPVPAALPPPGTNAVPSLITLKQ
eukprot:m.48541 g.48541  ORF g.48541 m.48541 type:complete len:261 (-) comp15264_c0_seq1:2144-2926(-)